ncbi:hypothetical protein RJ640_010821 [Escallonia rubra]|uniref:Protein transport protein Sec24-like At3g07100 n=1 Tax=Escallonia rubra TaxID=112253 RepID=A0AA88R4Q6_9ASTE|nr:hypothetical protein RJ640_010821 [Escallonia rubra]
MGTENTSSANTPPRPVATPFAAPQSTPFSSSRPVAGPVASAFRPSPALAPQTTMPLSSSGPVVGSEASGYRPTPPGRYSGPSVPPPPSSYGPPTGGPFQRFPTPQFPSTTQAPPRTLPVGQPVLPSHSAGQVSSMAASISPPPQIPSVPMGFPPQSISGVPSSVNAPPSSIESSFFSSRPNLQPSSPAMVPSYPAARGTFQPALPGYPGRQPNMDSASFLAHQGGYEPPRAVSAPFVSHPGGYVPPPPLGAPQGFYPSGQMQPLGSAPPTGAVQGLIEDFSSLSFGSVPGSFDPGLDSKALPRPLEGDVEPSSFAEMYPMNCDARFLRLTTSAIPSSQSLVSRWHLPLGAVVCPLAETPAGEEVPVVNFGTTGIIRCRRCRTYVNPYVTFTDGGRKWRCNICALLNDVSGDYFAHLDASGRRIDLDQRPELIKGSVEFIAPAEYMVRPPMPPVYFFLIDVSISAVRSGMLESSLTQPQMMVISDLDDIFIPLPDDLLVNLSESRTVVDAFLESLPTMFQDNVNVESAFGPALKAAFMIVSQLGGKLLIFQNTLPSLGVGRLRLRGDDIRVYGTDKEHVLRIPEDPFYKQMAADFTKYQIAVNVYAFSDKYTDIASLGTLAKYTGGQVYYYPSFHSAIQKEKLRHELTRDLTRETAWEAVMRVRCVRFTSYHGNFMLRSTDLLALPAVDCDKAYAMQLCLEDTLLTTQTVYFQVALFAFWFERFTSSSGERRIRVHTAAAPVVTELGEMYRQADTGAIVSLFSRLAIEKSLSYKLEEARNSVQQRIVKALREYRNLYAVQHRVGSRMIFPESLRFFILYGLALCKSAPIRGGYADVQLDERCAAGYTMMALPVKRLLKLLYPNLMRIDEYLLQTSLQADEFENVCKRLPLTAESLDSRGLYIYDDGFRFVIWFGRMLSPDIAKNLLREDFATDYSRATLSERDNDMSRKLMRILKKLRETDQSYYQLSHLVRQGEQPREGFFLLSNLVEDQTAGVNGYLEWILQIHRQIQQNA